MAVLIGEGDRRPPGSPGKHTRSLSSANASLLCVFGGMSAVLLLIKRSVVESRLYVCICEETEVIKNSSSFHFSSSSPDWKHSLMTPQLKHRCLCLFFSGFVSCVFSANDTFLIPPFNRPPLVQPEAAFVRRKLQ